MNIINCSWYRKTRGSWKACTKQNRLNGYKRENGTVGVTLTSAMDWMEYCKTGKNMRFDQLCLFWNGERKYLTLAITYWDHMMQRLTQVQSWCCLTIICSQCSTRWIDQQSFPCHRWLKGDKGFWKDGSFWLQMRDGSIFSGHHRQWCFALD